MKYLFLILALFAMLLTLPAPDAWSQPSEMEQCMEACLAPAIRSRDPEAIETAIQKCATQCSGPVEGVYAADGPSGSHLGRCLTDCAGKHRHCLSVERDPLKCQIQFENSQGQVKHLLKSKDERKFTPVGGVEGVYSMKRLGT